MADGRISWDRESSCTSNLDEELEHWQNHLHELSTLQCNMMMKSLCCVLSEVRKLPHYDSLTDVDKLLDEFENEFPKGHCFQELDLALCAMHARWWGTHKYSFDEWQDYRRMMRLWFGRPNTRLTEKYNERDDLFDHLVKWNKAWGKTHSQSGCTSFAIPWIQFPLNGIWK